MPEKPKAKAIPSKYLEVTPARALARIRNSDEMLDSIATLIEAEERASFAIETASDALSDIQFTIKDLTENAKSLALGGAK